MKAAVFIADLQEAVPRVTPRRLRTLLLLVAGSAVLLALLLALFHLVPQIGLKELQSYGYLGVFLANLIPSLSVVVPVHFFLPGQAVNVFVAALGNPIPVALVAAAGGTLGEITSYYVGYGGQRLFHLDRFRRYHTAERWMKNHGWLAVVLFAFLPLFFFDLVGIAAGALRLSLPKFLFFTYLGRLPRAIVEIYFWTWVLENVLGHLPEWMNPLIQG